MKNITFCIGLSLLFTPEFAQAQSISLAVAWFFFFGPIAAIILSVTLGILLRSWRHTLLGIAWVLLWATWYWAAAQTTTADVMFWIPVAAIQIQIAGFLAWALWIILRRSRT